MCWPPTNIFPGNASMTRSSEYILVVDDDWMNREVIETYLQTAGYRVHSAHNGAKALEIAEQATPALVVLDIKMPGMDGFEVCAQLKSRENTRFTPIMIVTALEDDADRLKAIEAGADDFLTKPFNSLIMLTRIKSMLRIYRLHVELENTNALLKRVLKRYVAEELTDVILADPDNYLRLGGSSRTVTVMFADIRGFTHFAEAHPAEEVLTVLNHFFSRLTQLVFQYHGTFDKYMGDEIMCFFGAPVTTGDESLNAVHTAIEMQSVFNETCAEFDNPFIQQLGLGIGLNTGEAAVGNVGSERVMNYTVIGDTVNIAQRLQQIAPSGHIFISETTYQLVKDVVNVRKLKPLKLTGRNEPVIAYDLLKVMI